MRALQRCKGNQKGWEREAGGGGVGRGVEVAVQVPTWALGWNGARRRRSLGQALDKLVLALAADTR